MRFCYDSFEMHSAEKIAQDVSGHGVAAALGFPRFSECGYGHWECLDRHTVPLMSTAACPHCFCFMAIAW